MPSHDERGDQVDEERTRVALVTGAAGGMGRAIAARLASAGTRVAVNDLTLDQLGGVAMQLAGQGFEVLPVAGDITVEAQVEAMIETVTARLGPVDVLINNAGVLRPTRFVEISEAEWTFVVDVSLK